jgi:Uma2 family endonuclease
MTTLTKPGRRTAAARAATPAPRLFTVDEYERLIETGIVRGNERVQLLDGVIVCMAPMLPPHMASIMVIQEALASGLPREVQLRIQGPIRLPPYGEPEPDLAVVRRRSERYFDRHPEPEDIFLVIEVADSSVRRDRRDKIPRYAEAGIPEAWLVDLPGDRVMAHREPKDGSYTITLTLRRGDSVSPLAFPDLQLSVDELLGPRRAGRSTPR